MGEGYGQEIEVFIRMKSVEIKNHIEGANKSTRKVKGILNLGPESPRPWVSKLWPTGQFQPVA